MSGRFNGTAGRWGRLPLIAAALALLWAVAGFARAQEAEDYLDGARQREELLARLNDLAAAAQYETVLAELELLPPEERDSRLENLRGFCLAGLGRHREAASVYEAALRRDLGRAELHRNFAISLRELGMTGRALAEFEEAVRLAPEDPETRLALGESLLHFGRLKRAGEELERAARLRPGDARVHRARGRFAARTGDMRLEWHSWSRVDSLEADAESARELARMADAPIASLAWYQLCAERDPAAFDCWARVGELELQLENWLAAATALERARNLGAGGLALHNLYLALQRGGEIERLEALLQGEPPEIAASWGVVALARRAVGRSREALEAVRSGREMEPEELVLANLEGVLLAESGDRQAAERIWRWVLERDPSNGDARANLGLE